MSVKYNVIACGNPSDAVAPKKHYPSAVADDETSLRQVAKRASEISTVSMPDTVADTVAVIEALLTIIPDEIRNGRIVKLGDFGSLCPRLVHSFRMNQSN